MRSSLTPAAANKIFGVAVSCKVVPTVAQWVKDPALPRLWSRPAAVLGFSPWLGNFSMLRMRPLKNEKKIKKKTETSSPSTEIFDLKKNPKILRNHGHSHHAQMQKKSNQELWLLTEQNKMPYQIYLKPAPIAFGSSPARD